MVGGKRVLGLVGLLATVLVCAPSGVAPVQECSQGSRTSGECVAVTTEVSDSGVTVGAEIGLPGTGPGPPSTPPPSTRAPGGTWVPPPPRAPVLGSESCVNIVTGSCRGSSPSKNPPVATPTPPTPPTMLSDVASFVPVAPGVVVQPGWWSLPRVPTNIYSPAGRTTQAGELLGWPIEVRFTPVAFVWSYGDGVTRRVLVAGGSWGGAQFSSTATSHTYRSPGLYRVGLVVEHSVEYRFPGDVFVSLPGLVSTRGGAIDVRVLTVSPVLAHTGCSPGSVEDGRCS